MLRDPHVYVRLHALRVAERHLDDVEIAKRVMAMLDDRDIRVRYQLALTLGQFERGDIPAALAQLAARDGHRPWVRAALVSSAHRNRGRFVDALMTRAKDSARDLPRFRPLLRELVRQIGRQSTDEDLEFVARWLIADEVEADLLSEWLLELTRGPPTAVERLKLALSRESTDLTLTTLVNRAIDNAQKRLVDPNATLAETTAAVEALKLAPVNVFCQWLPALIDLRQPPEIKQAAIEASGHFSEAKVAAIVIEHLPELSPRLRGQALQVILTRPAWVVRLLARMESGQINSVLLPASIRQQLLRYPHDDVRKKTAQLMAVGQNADRSAVVDKYSARLKSLTGDPDRGRAVFRKSCVACHRLGDEGNDIGPAIGGFANQGASQLLSNILDPSRDVDSQYLAYSILLEDGRMLSGMIASESANALNLQDAEGKTIALSRDEIDELRSTTLSLMPDNFENEIKPQAMADLIAFLLNQGP